MILTPYSQMFTVNYSVRMDISNIRGTTQAGCLRPWEPSNNIDPVNWSDGQDRSKEVG